MYSSPRAASMRDAVDPRLPQRGADLEASDVGAIGIARRIQPVLAGLMEARSTGASSVPCLRQRERRRFV